MTTTALLWKMNDELFDDDNASSNPQNFQRESSHASSSSSFEDCEERKQKRKEVAIFVKVLLDYLERANELDLKQLTKNTIADCIHQNRLGELPEYADLASAIQTNTRAVVGEWHWTRAKLIILYARQSARRKSGDEVSQTRSEMTSRSA